jgi:probable rRNA maturation factor
VLHKPSTRDRTRLMVAVTDERGRPVARSLGPWLARVSPPRAAGVVNVAVVSDGQVRRLNRDYRGLDYATDVLSFVPAGKEAHARQARPFLGDIVIARGVARRQARRAGHAETTELRVLALHGLLHLLGYDHERDRGEMARLEQRLRRRGGLREGLIERR